MHCRHHVCYIESCNEGRTHYIGRIPQSMPNEMKKRAVLDRLKEKYIRAARTPTLKNQENISLELSVDDFRRTLHLTNEELGTILLEIEHDYNERITARPHGGRSRREYYDVEVNATAFPAELLAEKYTLSRHDGYWCLTLPGETEMRPIGSVGSLKGELFAVLSRRLGKTMNVEELPGIAGQGVRNMRTERPEMRQIRNALREINETMHGAVGRRFRLTPPGARIAQVQWKKMQNYLWNAMIYRSRGRWRVGVLKGENPPSRRKHV